MKLSSREVAGLIVLIVGIALVTVGACLGDFGSLMKYAIFVCLECMGIA